MSEMDNLRVNREKLVLRQNTRTCCKSKTGVRKPIEAQGNVFEQHTYNEFEAIQNKNVGIVMLPHSTQICTSHEM